MRSLNKHRRRTRPLFSTVRRYGTAGLLAFATLLQAGHVRAEATGPVSEPSLAEESRIGIVLKLANTLEFGLHRSDLTQGNPTWSGGFVKGAWQRNPDVVWLGEVSAQHRFDDRGVYLSLGATRVFNRDWYGALFAATSAGGFFLPRLRLDAFISRKWLDKRNLVTTAGLSHIRAKDEHRDMNLFLGTSYYFETPWIVEGGLHFNRSDPGGVAANNAYFAVTRGRAGDYYLTLRHSAGHEAYQLIGPDATISDFFSRSSSLVWRKWLSPRVGFNLRAERYSNPFYRRNSVEVSTFQDF